MPPISGLNCEKGFYYEVESELCRACHSSCSGSICFGPEEENCIVCPSGQYFNLATLACTSTCPYQETKSVSFSRIFLYEYAYAEDAQTGQLAATQISKLGISLCRPFELYIDPSSTSNLEIGLQAFPFRTLNRALHEIFNVFDFLREVVVYLRAGFDYPLNEISIIASSQIKFTYYGGTARPTLQLYSTTPEADFAEVGTLHRVSSFAEYNFALRIDLPTQMNSLNKFSENQNFNVYRSLIDFDGVNIEALSVESGGDDISHQFMWVYQYDWSTINFKNLDVRYAGWFFFSSINVYIAFTSVNFDLTNTARLLYINPATNCLPDEQSFVFFQYCNFSGMLNPSPRFLFSVKVFGDVLVRHCRFENVLSSQTFPDGFFQIERGTNCDKVGNINKFEISNTVFTHTGDVALS